METSVGRAWRLAAALSIIVVVPVTAGCSRYFGCAPGPPSDITVSDLAGVYTSSDGGKFELREDGHYDASNVPPDLVDRSAEGTWTLDVASKTSEDLRLGDTQLWISGDRAEPWLYRFEGDPDSCDLVEFRRNR